MKRNILAVIHARGGSKRIPLKNLADLNGKPLLAYPILLAKASKHITRILVSSDHPQMMDTGRQWGAEVPFRRPSNISKDVPSEWVTLHALKFLQEHEHYAPEIVVTLTPATPFTKAATLDQGIDLLLRHPAWDSVVSVRKAIEHPEWTFWKDEKTGTFRTVLGNAMNGKYNVSQNLKPAYYPMGAFFINRSDALIKNRCLYGRRFGAVSLDPEKNIDIDTPADLKMAKKLVS